MTEGCAIDAVAKWDVVHERQAKRQERRERRRCHRRCFWTRPLGHKWEEVGTGGYGWWEERCLGCGWVKKRWMD